MTVRTSRFRVGYETRLGVPIRGHRVRVRGACSLAPSALASAPMCDEHAQTIEAPLPVFPPEGRRDPSHTELRLGIRQAQLRRCRWESDPSCKPRGRPGAVLPLASDPAAAAGAASCSRSAGRLAAPAGGPSSASTVRPVRESSPAGTLRANRARPALDPIARRSDRIQPSTNAPRAGPRAATRLADQTEFFISVFEEIIQ